MWSVPSRRSDPSTAAVMCAGRLDRPVCLPSSSNAKPNFVAMMTWSRTGASASPTISSLANGDAPVDGGADQRNALLGGGNGQVALAQAHAAVPDGRDLQPLAERSGVHVRLLSQRGSARIVVVRASGLLMCATAAAEPWYLRAYAASAAGSTSGCPVASTSIQVTSRATPPAWIRPWRDVLVKRYQAASGPFTDRKYNWSPTRTNPYRARPRQRTVAAHRAHLDLSGAPEQVEVVL